MSKPAEGPSRSPILITMGEPSGIGPEVAAKAWSILGGTCGGRPLRLVGTPNTFRAAAEIDDAAFWPVNRGGSAVIAAINTAVDAALSGHAGAIVTAPIQKSKLLEQGFSFAGH